MIPQSRPGWWLFPKRGGFLDAQLDDPSPSQPATTQAHDRRFLQPHENAGLSTERFLALEREVLSYVAVQQR